MLTLNDGPTDYHFSFHPHFIHGGKRVEERWGNGSGVERGAWSTRNRAEPTKADCTTERLKLPDNSPGTRGGLVGVK